MVLLVNQEKLERLPETTADLFQLFPFLSLQAEWWKKSGKFFIPDKGTLYVRQGEYAIVPHSDNRVRFVGSEDATTCHVVLFINKETGSVAVAHFDGSENENQDFDIMINCVAGGSSSNVVVEVFAIGGFSASPEVKGVQESMKLSLQLLELMKSSTYSFKLIQWCCCELNTNAASGPYFYGLCYDRLKKTAVPASFQSEGPDAALRAASSMFRSSIGMRNIYNSENHSIRIESFSVPDKNRWKYLLTYSNDDILRLFSTSPTVEPPTFCRRIRDQFRILQISSARLRSLFADGRARVYTLQEDGTWICVMSPSADRR